MKFTVSKENILKPLSSLIAIADKKHSNHILNNILFNIEEINLRMIASDLDTEVIADIPLDFKSTFKGSFLLYGRKILDIIKNVPDDSVIEFSFHDKNKIIVLVNKSKFSLFYLDSNSFPVMQEQDYNCFVNINQSNLIYLIKRIQFAMANNDIRYFLNGILWEINEKNFKAVATDGHRMALGEIFIENTQSEKVQVIIPKKSISEIQKIMNADTNTDIQLKIGSNHFKIVFGNYQFTSKLVDGRYPDYERVIPKNNTKVLTVNRILLKNSLLRTAILSNEKYRGVKLEIESNKLLLSAKNPDHEEATDELKVDYQDSKIEICFNIGYLLDVLNVMSSEDVHFYFSDSSTSVLIKDEFTRSDYVIMPIRL